MKELLEEYVMEAMQMRQELDLLRRIISAELDTPLELDLDSLRMVAVVAIQVEDGKVQIG